jgi:hypothetical protein
MESISGRMAHGVDRAWNDSCNEIMCSGFDWKVFKSLKILSSFDSSRTFFAMNLLLGSGPLYMVRMCDGVCRSSRRVERQRGT